MGIASIGVSQAACRQADMTGTWFAMGVSGNIVGSYFDITNRCKIQVNTAGAVVASGSSCTYYDWTGEGVSPVTGGKLKLASNCSITGYVSICEPGGCITMRVAVAQMESNKTAFPMQGYSASDPGLRYVFNFVKR
ncbi:MAG TPA: hypothetical protein VIR60_09335 [Gammaproteobacteria bacterium]